MYFSIICLSAWIGAASQVNGSPVIRPYFPDIEKITCHGMDGKYWTCYPAPSFIPPRSPGWLHVITWSFIGICLYWSVELYLFCVRECVTLIISFYHHQKSMSSGKRLTKYANCNMVFMSDGLAVCLYSANSCILLPDKTGVRKHCNKTDNVISHYG